MSNTNLERSNARGGTNRGEQRRRRGSFTTRPDIRPLEGTVALQLASRFSELGQARDLNDLPRVREILASYAGDATSSRVTSAPSSTADSRVRISTVIDFEHYEPRHLYDESDDGVAETPFRAIVRAPGPIPYRDDRLSRPSPLQSSGRGLSGPGDNASESVARAEVRLVTVPGLRRGPVYVNPERHYSQYAEVDGSEGEDAPIGSAAAIAVVKAVVDIQRKRGSCQCFDGIGKHSFVGRDLLD